MPSASKLGDMVLYPAHTPASTLIHSSSGGMNLKQENAV